MSHRFRHHTSPTSLAERDAEIAAAWNVGRASVLWAIACVVFAFMGLRSPSPEVVATQHVNTAVADAALQATDTADTR